MERRPPTEQPRKGLSTKYKTTEKKRKSKHESICLGILISIPQLTIFVDAHKRVVKFSARKRIPSIMKEFPPMLTQVLCSNAQP